MGDGGGFVLRRRVMASFGALWHGLARVGGWNWVRLEFVAVEEGRVCAKRGTATISCARGDVWEIVGRKWWQFLGAA